MGQIFDRIKRIAKSYGNDADHSTTWAESILSSDDDELRRIIEELSSGEPSRQTHTNHQPPPPPPTSIPDDVKRAHTTLNVPVGATPADMKMAYRTAIAQWHPDKFVNVSPEEHTRAQQRAREINAAIITLKNHYRFS